MHADPFERAGLRVCPRTVLAMYVTRGRAYQESKRKDEGHVRTLESEEVRAVDGHNKRHQGELVFGKVAHR
jgi:hypothetical protein